MDTEDKKTEEALDKPKDDAPQSVDAKAIPTKLKENFDSYKYNDNETIIDSVSSKIEEAIGDDVRKSATDKENEHHGHPLTSFEQFLNDTNLTFRQFIMFVTFIMLIIVVIGFSIYLLFSFLGTEPEEVDITENVVVSEVKTDVIAQKEGFFSKFFSKEKTVEPVKTPTEVVKEDPIPVDDTKVEEVKDPVVKVETPFVPTQIGKSIPSKFSVASLKVATKIGFGEISENNLSYFVRTYRKVRNIYNTDVFNYLSTVPDRKKGFDQFLIQFKGAFEEFKLANEDLQQEIAVLTARLEQIQVQTTELENKFFGDLDNLESEKLPETLQAFQEISQKRTIVLSELKARESVFEKYKKAVPIIEEKIAAISVNEDPFVKGVKVVDFAGVDLDLVIESRP